MKGLTKTVMIGGQTRAISYPIKLRSLWILSGLLGICLLFVFISLTSGVFPISTKDVYGALTGQAPKNITTIVIEWRLPRIVMALLFGAALGISGAIFQSIIRNPLGSPDIIGFNTGAYTGVLLTIIFISNNYWQVAMGALVGGISVATLVYLLAYRQGITGFRLIIVGIAVSAMLGSINTWLSITIPLETAMNVALWGAGTLNGLTWRKSLPTLVIMLVTFVFIAHLSRRLALLEMGDEMAAALGTPTERSRLLLMLFGVILTAGVTAAAGPISFIALAAPQIARRLTKEGSVTLMASGLMGATLLIVADWCAQFFFRPNQLPVGIVTVSIGGLYLIWLLMREVKH